MSGAQGFEDNYVSQFEVKPIEHLLFLNQHFARATDISLGILNFTNELMITSFYIGGFNSVDTKNGTTNTYTIKKYRCTLNTDVITGRNRNINCHLAFRNSGSG